MRCDAHHDAQAYLAIPEAIAIVRTWPHADPDHYDTNAYCIGHDRLAVSDAILLRIPYARIELPQKPAEVPAGLQYELFGGGKFSRFVLTGPYSDLPAATGRVFDIFAQRGMTLRSDFCIESYVSDPQTTPEDKLITEILIPTA